MAAPNPLNVPGENRLLASLPRKEFSRLRPQMDRVCMGLHDLLYEADAPITHVYFPLSGVMSLIVAMSDGPQVEVCTIGNEGMVGTPLFLGTDKSPTRAFAQISGECLKLPADTFQEEIGNGGKLEGIVRHYIQALMNQISQSLACNHIHSVEKRMCRWLLMTHDRVGADQFNLTQEFMAQMLGVRRASVSVVAGILQRAGLISYHRGRITIADRKGLEATCCECYRVIRQGFEQLLA